MRATVARSVASMIVLATTAWRPARLAITMPAGPAVGVGEHVGRVAAVEELDAGIQQGSSSVCLTCIGRGHGRSAGVSSAPSGAGPTISISPSRIRVASGSLRTCELQVAGFGREPDGRGRSWRRRSLCWWPLSTVAASLPGLLVVAGEDGHVAHLESARPGPLVRPRRGLRPRRAVRPGRA